MLKTGFATLLLAVYALGQSNICENQEDGHIPEFGCRSYTVCLGEEPFIVDCAAIGMVFNPQKGECDLASNTPAPCGTVKDCSERDDGRYADYTRNCTSFFTCLGGVFLGSNPCPAGTVFDEVLCICNFPGDVYQPCGTKPDDGNEPDERGCPLGDDGSGDDSYRIFN